MRLLAVALFLALPAAASAQGIVDAQFHVIAPDKKPDGNFWDSATGGMLAGRVRGILPDIIICVRSASMQQVCAPTCEDSRECTQTLRVPANEPLKVDVYDVDIKRHDPMFALTIERANDCKPCRFQNADGSIPLTVSIGGDLRQNATETCPTQQARSTIENMIKSSWWDATDYPRSWQNWLPQFPNRPTVAQLSRYTRQLGEEFRKIADKAEASRDVVRIYSAARWFIQQSDPSTFALRRTSYEGQECEIIRNRIVVMLGTKAWEKVKSNLIKYLPTNRKNVQRLIEDGLQEAVGSIPEYAQNLSGLRDDYQAANDLIDHLTRPPKYADLRQDVLNEVADRTAQAMTRIGQGTCLYYSNVVKAWDYVSWKHQTLRMDVPPDWEHDFFESAEKCLLE